MYCTGLRRIPSTQVARGVWRDPGRTCAPGSARCLVCRRASNALAVSHCPVTFYTLHSPATASTAEVAGSLCQSSTDPLAERDTLWVADQSVDNRGSLRRLLSTGMLASYCAPWAEKEAKQRYSVVLCRAVQLRRGSNHREALSNF